MKKLLSLFILFACITTSSIDARRSTEEKACLKLGRNEGKACLRKISDAKRAERDAKRKEDRAEDDKSVKDCIQTAKDDNSYNRDTDRNCSDKVYENRRDQQRAERKEENEKRQSEMDRRYGSRSFRSSYSEF